jgi:hypothetical protein
MGRLLILLLVMKALAAADAAGFGDDDFAAHLAILKPTVPAGFTVLVEKPFVVIGDQEPSEVERQAVGVVRWAAALLTRDFFPKPPDAIYDIWLFRDKDSYDRQVGKLTGSPPISPYGFCSPAERTLYMNIATGGGTLVHEMTHAYMHGNAPRCPPWLNEGLASLFEACGRRDGHIIGGVNWRLPALQKALRAGTAPSFADLARLDHARFYGDDSGANYGTARYLFYYLQEKDLLRGYIKDWLADQANDPTGHATLVKTLGAPDMAAFRAEWERFALALQLPAR